MIKIKIYIILCLLAAVLPIRAVTYSGIYTPSTSYRSEYGSSYSAEPSYHDGSAFSSALSSSANGKQPNDGYRSSYATQKSVIGSTSSFGAISASNFSSLNGEGGEFDQSGSRPGARKAGRPDSGSGGIGIIEEHSPIGDTPWMIMALLALLYIAYTAYRRRKEATA